MRSVHAIGFFIIIVSSCIFATGGAMAAFQGHNWQSGLYGVLAVGVFGYAFLLGRLSALSPIGPRSLVESRASDITSDPHAYQKLMDRYRATYKRPARRFSHWRLGYHK